MKKISLFLSAFALCAFSLTSCNSCVDCTDCDEEIFEVSDACYDEVKDEYDSKSEWKDDIKDYEEETGCKCN